MLDVDLPLQPSIDVRRKQIQEHTCNKKTHLLEVLYVLLTPTTM